MFSKFDILGPEIKLKVKNHRYFRSNFGGVMTILLFILSLLAFVAFGRDIIEKQIPEIVYNVEQNLYPYMNFSTVSKQHFFMFALSDTTNTPVKEIERKLKVYMTVQDVDPALTAKGLNSFKETMYPVEKCKEEYIPDEVKSNLLKMPLEHYYCLPETMHFDLVGSFGIGKQSNIKVGVDICKNSTANNNACYPDEFIRKNLSVLNMVYVTDDARVDGYNYTDPKIYSFQAGIIKTTAHTFTRWLFWYKNIDYITDDGFILESLRNESHYTLYRIDREPLPMTNTGTLFSHIITVMNVKDVYKRKYIKIQGVFALIGGFITFSKILLQFLVEYFTLPDYLSIFAEDYNKNKEDSSMTQHLSQANLSQTQQMTVTVNDMHSQTVSMNHNVMINNFAREIPREHKEIKEIELIPNKNPPQFLYSNQDIPFEKKKKLVVPKFAFLLKILRWAGFCSSKLKEKNRLLKLIQEKEKKHISIERFSKINRKLEVLEFILLEDYQREMSKHVRVSKSVKGKDYKNECKELLKINIDNSKNATISKKILNNI